MIFSEMITDSRRHLDASAKFLTGDEVGDRLFAAQQEIIRSIVKEDASFFVARSDISFTADTALYDLPLNARLGSRLIFVENTTNNLGVELPAANFQQYLAIEAPGITNLSNRWSFIMEGDQVRVTPTPSGTQANAIKVWYVPTYGNMVEGTVSAVTATSLSFFTTDPDWTANFGKVDSRDDYYNGMEVRITAGTGIGQTRTITDYTGSTKTATVATWDTNPDTDSIFAVVCPVPEDHHSVVALRASLLMSAKNRNRGRELADLYYGTASHRGHYFELMAWISSRAQSRNEIVEPMDYGE